MTKIKHRQFWVEEGQARAFFTDDKGVDHDIEKLIMNEQEQRMVQASLEHIRVLLQEGKVTEAIKYLDESLEPLEEGASLD